MIEGRPFLYQAIGGTVYYVDKEGFQVLLSNSNQPWSSIGRIVAFIDGENAYYRPSDIILNDRSVQFIVASSPKGANPTQRWMKQLCGYRVVTRLATSLWSRRELFITGSVLAMLAFLLSTLD